MALALQKIDELIAYIDSCGQVSSSSFSCHPCSNGIPYATPMDAFKDNFHEKIVYVTATRTGQDNKNVSNPIDANDFIGVVNVDPTSPDYCKIIYELNLGNEMELHHFGWNACAACYGDNKSLPRRYLIAPSFGTGSIFIIDTSDPIKIKLHKEIKGEDLKNKYGVSFPHTSHCLSNGNVMISFLGFENTDDVDWLSFDGRNDFKCLGKWIDRNNLSKNDDSKDNNDIKNALPKYQYDFWYQPYHNIMISSEWGDPRAFSKGFNPKDVEQGNYGTSIHFWDWEKHKKIKTINFDASEVCMALETRFCHNPKSSNGFINGALTSNVLHCYQDTKTKEWMCNHKYIQVEGIEMENWILPKMPGLITDILISMDDKYLYFCNWLHGDIRQYNISNPLEPKLTGQVFTGGLLRKDNGYNYKPKDPKKIPIVPKIKGKQIYGGPQMIQLSLDGKRLYVTNSLFTPFDAQFFPNLVKHGGMILMCDVDHKNGGIKLNQQFCVDFETDTKSGVPARPHEMRYPGGDCTSDIFLVQNKDDDSCCH